MDCRTVGSRVARRGRGDFWPGEKCRPHRRFAAKQLTGSSGQFMSKRIHVLINGEKFGPYPETEFRQHLAEKKILRTDLVWREGLPAWIEAEEFLAALDKESAAALPVSPPTAFQQAILAAEKGDAASQFKLALLH